MRLRVAKKVVFKHWTDLRVAHRGGTVLEAARRCYSFSPEYVGKSIGMPGAMEYVLDRRNRPRPCADIEYYIRALQAGYPGCAKRVLRHELLENDVQVSTVFLGINHAFPGMKEKCLIYETMVFGGPMDLYQDRYATERAAKRGHRRTVLAVLETMKGQLH